MKQDSHIHLSSSIFKNFINLDFHVHLFISFMIHLFLILFCEVQDQVFNLKYTDIDYIVFTDAARFVWNGKSPFDRLTYRYTPWLAWILTPNIFLFSQFGKILFSLFDLLGGWIIEKILQKHFNLKKLSLLWLYNPLTLIISTRGSSDSIICTLVFMVLFFFVQKHYSLSGLVYGVVIHFKIYPIIYAFSFYIVLSHNTFRQILVISKSKFSFFISAICSFIALTYISFIVYGNIYIEEAWLYHFRRQDLQHNFSPYFYLYLFTEKEYQRKIISLLAFVPQFILIVLSAFFYNLKSKKLENLFMSLFVQTFLFVTLNKVITAQYFEWYICFLPLIVSFINIRRIQWLVILGFWVFSIAQWLLPAYLLEFQKWNCIDWVGGASITFSVIHLSILTYLHKKFRFDRKKYKLL